MKSSIDFNIKSNLDAFLKSVKELGKIDFSKFKDNVELTEDAIIQLTKELDRLRFEQSLLNKENKDYNTTLKELSTALKSSKNDFDRLSNEVVNLNNDYNQGIVKTDDFVNANASLQRSLKIVNDEITTLSAQETDLNSKIRANTAVLVANKADISNLSTSLKDLNKVQEINRSNVQQQNTSLAALRRELVSLTAEYAKLSRGERENETVGVALQKRIVDLTKYIKDLEFGILRTERNVGNYKDSILEAVSASNILQGSITDLVDTSNDATNSTDNQIDALTRLNVILGTSVNSYGELEKKVELLENLFKTTKFDDQAFEQLQIELRKSKDELEDFDEVLQGRNQGDKLELYSKGFGSLAKGINGVTTASELLGARTSQTIQSLLKLQLVFEVIDTTIEGIAEGFQSFSQLNLASVIKADIASRQIKNVKEGVDVLRDSVENTRLNDIFSKFDLDNQIERTKNYIEENKKLIQSIEDILPAAQDLATMELDAPDFEEPLQKLYDLTESIGGINLDGKMIFDTVQEGLDALNIKLAATKIVLKQDVELLNNLNSKFFTGKQRDNIRDLKSILGGLNKDLLKDTKEIGDAYTTISDTIKEIPVDGLNLNPDKLKKDASKIVSELDKISTSVSGSKYIELLDKEKTLKDITEVRTKLSTLYDDASNGELAKTIKEDISKLFNEGPLNEIRTFNAQLFQSKELIASYPNFIQRIFNSFKGNDTRFWKEFGLSARSAGKNIGETLKPLGDLFIDWRQKWKEGSKELLKTAASPLQSLKGFFREFPSFIALTAAVVAGQLIPAFVRLSKATADVGPGLNATLGTLQKFQKAARAIGSELSGGLLNRFFETLGSDYRVDVLVNTNDAAEKLDILERKIRNLSIFKFESIAQLNKDLNLINLRTNDLLEAAKKKEIIDSKTAQFALQELDNLKEKVRLEDIQVPLYEGEIKALENKNKLNDEELAQLISITKSKNEILKSQDGINNFYAIFSEEVDQSVKKTNEQLNVYKKQEELLLKKSGLQSSEVENLDVMRKYVNEAYLSEEEYLKLKEASIDAQNTYEVSIEATKKIEFERNQIMENILVTITQIGIEQKKNLLADLTNLEVVKSARAANESNRLKERANAQKDYEIKVANIKKNTSDEKYANQLIAEQTALLKDKKLSIDKQYYDNKVALNTANTNVEIRNLDNTYNHYKQVEENKASFNNLTEQERLDYFDTLYKAEIRYIDDTAKLRLKGFDNESKILRDKLQLQKATDAQLKEFDRIRAEQRLTIETTSANAIRDVNIAAYNAIYNSRETINDLDKAIVDDDIDYELFANRKLHEELSDTYNKSFATQKEDLEKRKALNKEYYELQRHQIEENFNNEVLNLDKSDKRYELALTKKNNALKKLGIEERLSQKDLTRTISEENEKRIKTYIDFLGKLFAVGKQIADTFYQTQQTLNQQQENLLQDARNRINEQQQLVENKVKLTQEILTNTANRISELENLLKDASGANRDEILNNIEEEKTARRNALTEEKRLNREKVKLAKELNRLNIQSYEISVANAQATYQQAIMNQILTTTESALAIAALSANGAKKDPSFGILTTIAVATFAANLFSLLSQLDTGPILPPKPAQDLSTFAEGGYTGKGMDYRDETGYRVAGIVHENEYVVPSNVLNTNRGRDLVNELENMRSNKFAVGGFTAQPINGNLEALISKLNSNLVYTLNNLPNPVVSVIDINKTNEKLTRVTTQSKI